MYLHYAVRCDKINRIEKTRGLIFFIGATEGLSGGQLAKDFGGFEKEMKSSEEKPYGGKKNECYFNETVTGGRCSFRTSDKKMEP